jgi:hypothetical protein
VRAAQRPKPLRQSRATASSCRLIDHVGQLVQLADDEVERVPVDSIGVRAVVLCRPKQAGQPAHAQAKVTVLVLHQLTSFSGIVPQGEGGRDKRRGRHERPGRGDLRSGAWRGENSPNGPYAAEAKASMPTRKPSG